MILIAEPVHFQDTHLRVNTAMVALLRDIFKDEKVILFAEKNHVQEICKTEPRIETITYSKYSKEGSFYWFQKIVGEWIQIIKILKIAKKQKPTLLVWLSLFPTGHFLQSVLTFLFFRHQKQIIVVHSELEYLSQKTKKKSAIFLAFCLTKALEIPKKNVHYLALGMHIASPKMLASQRFHRIVHPFLFSAIEPKEAPSLPINICLLGTIQLTKNAHYFYQLASLFSEEIKQQKVSFNVVGKVFEEMIPYRNEWVNELAGNYFIPQNEYLNLLSQQDVVLFFYDEKMYRNSASGAILEAVNLSLPIISFKNNCFDALNENRTIGSSVHNVSEMKFKIEEILNFSSQYFSASKNSNVLFLLQNSFSLQSVRLEAIIASIISN